jgi:hypothetical protein
LSGASRFSAKNGEWKSAGSPIAARAATDFFYYGAERTIVRNLKDEVDRRAYHHMLKQLCLSERDFE